MYFKIKYHVIDGHKICTKCNINKPIDFYNKCKKTKSGIQAKCKACSSAYLKKRNLEHPEIKKENYKTSFEKNQIRAKKWRESNSEKSRIYFKKHYEENKQKISEQRKINRINNKGKNTKEKERKKEYAQIHKEEIKAYKTKYNKDNKDHIRNQQRIWKKNKRETDIKFRINESVSCNIRNTLYAAKKGKSWKTLVSYSIDELITHLESKFTKGMTWENYGKNGWEIDHIIPVLLFKFDSYNHPAFKACWSLENLQPLWATTNIAISYGEDSSYVGNSDKQHRIEITPKIKKFLDEVNGEVNGEESK